MSLPRSEFDPLVQRLIDVLESNGSDLPLRIDGAPDRIDFRSIKVMISSPLATLSEEREGLYQEIRRMPEVEPLMFEKNFDSGTPNIFESLKLVDDSDLFFALFDPAYAGCKIDEEPHKGKTYSQIEIERAIKRREETGWPLIFIFRKRSTKGHTLEAWQQQVLRSYAETPIISPRESDSDLGSTREPGFSTTKALLDTALATLNAHIIKIRGARAKHLWHSVEELRKKLDLREQELAANKVSHERLIATMHETHDRSVAIINRTNEASSEHQQKQIARLQDRLDRHHAKTAKMIALGAAVGVTSIVTALLSLGSVIPKFDATAVLRSIDGAGELIASSVGSRSLFATNMEHDPILQARKIAWAESVAPSFECSGPAREWTLSYLSGTFPLKLIRDNVCAAYAPLRLEVLVAGNTPCGYETAMSKDDWEKLHKSITMARLRITHVSLTGHASREPIDGTCGDPIPQKLREERRRFAGQPLSFPQDRVSTNRELAYVRAWVVAEVIHQAFDMRDGKGSPRHIDVDHVGVLDARGEHRTDRKVTIGISIERALPKSAS